MARKGQDLFVLLGQRLSPGSQGGRNSSASGAPGWFRSLFRAVSDPRPTSRQARTGKGKAAAGGGRKRPPRVPRGLLVPGWFVILLLLLGVTAGFVAGRWSVDRQGDVLNATVPKGVGVLPASFPDGDFGSDRAPSDPRVDPGYLPPEKQEEEVSTCFFLVLDYAASQRERAEALARYLRGQGLPSTRIREVKLESGSRWLTLCYVEDAADGGYSEAHAEECHRRLKRVQLPKFEPRLVGVVQALKSPQDDIRQFR